MSACCQCLHWDSDNIDPKDGMALCCNPNAAVIDQAQLTMRFPRTRGDDVCVGFEPVRVDMRTQKGHNVTR